MLSWMFIILRLKKGFNLVLLNPLEFLFILLKPVLFRGMVASMPPSVAVATISMVIAYGRLVPPVSTATASRVIAFEFGFYKLVAHVIVRRVGHDAQDC